MSDEIKAAVYCRLAKEEKPTAAIYCRTAISDEVAISEQEQTLRRYAAGQLFAIGGIYRDNGESGASLNRPAFKQMMSAIMNGTINCVIATDFSRLSRNYIEFDKWLTEMRERNVRIVIVNDAYDSAKPIDASLLAGFKKTVEVCWKQDHSAKVKAGIARARQRKQAEQK
jgi:DNA invertase Pin-like site-specific DNA recombinase